MTTDKLADQIFHAWRYRVNQENISQRYSSSERRELLSDLAEIFKKSHIPYDEVLSYKNAVMKALTT